MGRYIGVLALAIVLLLLNTQPDQAHSEPDSGAPQKIPKELSFAPGRILVKPEVNAPADTVASLNQENDARVEEKISDSQVRVVDLPKDLSVAEAVERYEDSPDIAYAEPDYEIYEAATPDDRSFPQLYGLDNTRQFNGTLDSDIDAPQAWNVTTGSANTVVAVIDTGVDIGHPDLRNNIWTNPDEIPGNNKDDDRNGYKDDVHGWDFLHDDATVYDSAEDSHGTHVAGTLAAEGNNSLGITGVAWQAKIMPLMIFSSDSVTYTSDAVEATNYAVAEGATISNNSWGSSTFSNALLEAIRNADAAGHLYVAGAGNGGADSIGDNNAKTPFYPASYNSPNIISVAASDQHDNLASFSNYSGTAVDLAAPGVEIYSTRPENTYGYGYGTSMATPHVSGAAALIKSRYPYLGGVEIKSRILRSVDQRRNLQGKLATGGRLNAARALGVNVTPPPSTSPEISKLGPAKTKDRKPAIRANVRDAQTNLEKESITGLYLDGRRVYGFSYSVATDDLRFQAQRKLSYGRHSVKVTAKDPQGLIRVKTWKFKIVRRR